MTTLSQHEFTKLYRTKKFLVIDDYAEIRGSIKRMIGKFGAEHVDTAHNGEEAMEKCQANDYDIILADYNLGEKKSGQQLLEEMRFRGLIRYSSLYVMITAETTRDKVYSAIEHQPDAYLAKPFTPPALKKRLDALLLTKDEMSDINAAADAGEIDRAIALCQQKIGENDRYRTQCQKMMGHLYFKSGQLDAAKGVYSNALQEREVLWAQIGLGKTLAAAGNLDEAEALFRKLIANKCPCMEVYDELAGVMNAKGQTFEAQSLLETAAKVSPDSITRQQKLAEMAEINDDMERAEKAYHAVMKLGNHSVYETPEAFFNYVNSVNKLAKSNDQFDKKRYTLAKEALERAKKRYGNDPAINVQSKFALSEVEAAAGHEDKARNLLGEAEESYERLKINAPANLVMSRAKALAQNGEGDKAREILEALAAEQGDDPGLMRMIDNCLDEPISESGKSQMLEFNREGKQLFDQQNYKEAIDYFNKALQIFPNHLALNLNLAMALLKEIGVSGKNPTYVSRCQRVVKKLNDLPTDHKYYKLYSTVCKQVSALDGDAA